MQLGEGLCPSRDLTGGCLHFNRGDMLLMLHGLLLSHEASETSICTYRVSHLKEKFMKRFSWLLKGTIAQLKSATVV